MVSKYSTCTLSAPDIVVPWLAAEGPRPDGDGRYTYGPIFEDPDAYRKATLTDPFIRKMKVTGGTFESATKERFGLIGGGYAYPLIRGRLWVLADLTARTYFSIAAAGEPTGPADR